MSYQTFKVQLLKNATIAKVTISRPKVLNAMNPKFFLQLEAIFAQLANTQTLRVVVLLAQGRVFSSGLDLRQYAGLFSYDTTQTDPARISTRLYKQVLKMQRQFLAVFESNVPVLVGVHGKCIGGGVDLVSMCDVRYCSADAEFSIKEIDIGMAADLGTLQFLPNLIGNQSAFRELAYTGRFFNASEAHRLGFVSRVLPNKEQMEAELMSTAELIAVKSPVGIHSIKQVVKRQFRKKIEDSLEYIARSNSALLLTKDTEEAITAFLQKRQPIFPKL